MNGKITCYKGGDEGVRCVPISSKVTVGDKARLDALREKLELSLADILHTISLIPVSDYEELRGMYGDGDE